MSRDVETACKYAIELAKKKNEPSVSSDHLLLGCLRMISEFGIVHLGGWNIDLEELGVDWLSIGEEKRHKVAYSQDVVDLLDRAAQIGRASESNFVRVEHLLAAYAGREDGLIGMLKRRFVFTGGQWRAAVAELMRGRSDRRVAPISEDVSPGLKEYLTPEEAAEVLAIHVQTLRAHVRSGKLPALRLAGERAIRIRRSDLEKVFEPAVQVD